MPDIHSRLFFRIISKNKEVYVLKIITLAIAFWCATLVILFSFHEFGYDRFHHQAGAIFRVLQRNNSETYIGNRLSNKIPLAVFNTLQTGLKDAIRVSRVKAMHGLNVPLGTQILHDQSMYAADPQITDIFSFEVIHGTLNTFKEQAGTAILSSSVAQGYFGTVQASGKTMRLYALGDTIQCTVAAVYRDFPQNSHEAFTAFIRFDPLAIQSLGFDPAEAGMYGSVLHGNIMDYQEEMDHLIQSNNLVYHLQPLPAIYFGPRVLGEDANHGDRYSILILVCITCLILFLALSSYINLTTLTLPHRSKEIAIKKLAGTSQLQLLFTFAKESYIIVGIAFILGIGLLLVTAHAIAPMLSIDLMALLLHDDEQLVLVMAGLLLILGLAPLLMTFKFIRATPNRLLSTETITFPRFKRIITFMQLGISLFLIVASIVIKRQINYSLLKEPGRNHEQIVYLNYPKQLTNEGLRNLRLGWNENNPHIVDVMATSQLPNRIHTKELHSEFYFMSVDPSFQEFFDLKMVEGNWFRPNDGDAVLVVNEKGKELLGNDTSHVMGVFKDMSGAFNLPEKPVKINIAPYFNYNFLCIRVLEVDIKRTVQYLADYFKSGTQSASVSFLNKQFEAWLKYQNRLNTISAVLAIISVILSCCAIYGLSISLVRDQLKPIAIHKIYGATTFHITQLLVREFAWQMLIALFIFGPVTYIFLNEWLKSFVYATHFNWLDPVFPLAYCAIIIIVVCGFQALCLNRADLTAALKG